MNKKIIAGIIFILGGSTFSGCAPMVSGAMNTMVDENMVFEKTAKYFGVTRKEIIISSINKEALQTTYQTKYAGNLYNCWIYYGEVTCKKPGA